MACFILKAVALKQPTPTRLYNQGQSPEGNTICLAVEVYAETKKSVNDQPNRV